MPAMRCPRCRVRLNRATTEHGVCFVCPKCNGRAVALALLRHDGSKDAVRSLWIQSHDKTGTPGAKCPVCDQPTVEVSLPIGPSSSGSALRLDVCAGCQFAWFDPAEFEQFPSAPKVAEEKTLPQPAREKLAIREVQMLASKAEAESDDGPPLDEPWRWLPAMLGMPIEQNGPAVNCWPWLTWGLSAVLVAIFAMTVSNLRVVIDTWGLVPGDPWRYGGLTFATNFFLHGGWLHLIGNVYFLLIFGDNVEDDLGRWRYALLIAVSALVGDVCHVLGNLHGAHSMIPSIGASGGISGVIVFYALRFPHAQLGMMLRYGFYFRWIRFPAYVAMLFWFLLQFFYAFEEQMGIGNVAALAHLGGAAVGVAAWCFWRFGATKESM